MADRQPSVKFMTPRGVLIYPKLNKPDTKWKPEGEYRAKVAVDPAEFDSNLVPKLEKLRTDHLEEIKAGIREKLAEAAKAKKGADVKKLTKAIEEIKETDTLFSPELDKATGDETGRVIVSAKMVASGISKKDKKPWTRTPPLFDAKGKKLPADKSIWGGTEAKVAVEARAYYTPKDNVVGVAFYLEAVQVLKLVVGSDKDAGSYGFGEEEGYTDDSEESGSPFPDESGDSENPAPPGAGDDF